MVFMITLYCHLVRRSQLNLRLHERRAVIDNRQRRLLLSMEMPWISRDS